VAVIEVHPRRTGRELVGERIARRDDFEDAVHIRRVDPVKVDRVRVRAPVPELDAKEFVLGRTDHGAGDAAVVRPGVELDTGRDLDRAVEGGDLVLADPALFVRERLRRIEQVVEVVRATRRRDFVTDHRRVPERRVVVTLVRRARMGMRVTGQLQPGERSSRDQRRRACEDLLPRKFRHV
jgi:hypothetical protein